METRTRRRGAAGVLAVPVAAQAATNNVSMGTPTSAQKTLGGLAADVNAFFPQTVSVHVGDTVRFTPNGFHTVDLPAKGSSGALPLLKFTKAGTYRYYCDVHAGMKATVKVLPKSKPVPSAKADASRVKNQIATAVKTAKTLTKATQPANTVSVGVAGKHGVEIFTLAPSNLTVPAGTTVTFTMSANSYEVQFSAPGTYTFYCLIHPFMKGTVTATAT